MARTHNLDKVSNHIMLETDLSEKDREKLLDVVELKLTKIIMNNVEKNYHKNQKEM